MGKFCPNCGIEINEGSKFCINCGAKLNASDNDVEHPEIVEDDKVAEIGKRNESEKKIEKKVISQEKVVDNNKDNKMAASEKVGWIIIAILVALTVGVTIAAFAISAVKGDSDDEEENNVTHVEFDEIEPVNLVTPDNYKSNSVKRPTLDDVQIPEFDVPEIEMPKSNY